MTEVTPKDRASTTPPDGANTPQDPAPIDRNPFLVVLTSLLLVFLVVALILYLTAARQSDSGDGGAGGTLGAANNWLTFAGYTFLATMIVGGITWHSTHRSK